MGQGGSKEPLSRSKETTKIKELKVKYQDLGQHEENVSITERATPDELEWAFENGAVGLDEALTLISNDKRGPLL